MSWLKWYYVVLFSLFLACEKPTNDENFAITTVVDPITGEITKIDEDVVGILQGSYGVTGTFTVDGTGIHVNGDYKGTSAPGPVWYLSNDAKSIVGGVRLSNSPKGAGAHTIPTDVALDYNYLIMWCQPFSVWIANGKLKK